MLSAKCMSCLVNRQLRLIESFDDERKKALYMREVFEILNNMGPGEASPVAVERIDRRFTEYFGVSRNFEEVKKKYNDILLGKEEELYRSLDSSDNRLLDALKLARIGNYIDFGALASVEEETLSDLVRRAPQDPVDQDTFAKFRDDISSAGKMVYIPDNCGEIVFDKILIRVIREEYPSLDLTAIVRGRPVLNDVTLTDAEYVGITTLCRVVGNGSGIAGTYLPSVSDEAKKYLEQADLILAKGQGNFETMFGCGLNVYYAFLCKCEWFERRFGMKMLEGVFVNERDKVFGSEGSTL
ncbi:MAG: DUF89 family protein [Clostridia bacterium]|nr:DUF89 family protein [Clostridia bacterium]